MFQDRQYTFASTQSATGTSNNTGFNAVGLCYEPVFTYQSTRKD